MSLNLSNPKQFLPLLLFIGFVFALIGVGFFAFGANPAFLVGGGLLMFMAILFFALINRRKMGF